MLVDGGDAGYVEQRGRDAPAELVLQRHIPQVRQRPEVDLSEGRIVLDDVEIPDLAIIGLVQSFLRDIRAGRLDAPDLLFHDGKHTVALAVNE
jgi:hypothetical protein